MLRTLPRSLFFLLLLVSTAAHAQQPDSLAAPAAAPDSLDAARLRAGSLPAFTTIQPALSRVAGVQVTPYSGAPGAWATVRIRGFANVTGSSQPLYVVDGVPVYNTDVTPENWSGAGAFFNPTPFTNTVATPHSPTANPLLDLPVEDVASVEVLKSAAATARYGMQGSNGVILISTRRGGDGRATPQPLRVRYAGWGGVQQVRQRYELLNARQYAGLANETAAATGRPAPYSAADLNGLTEVDWQDRVFRVAGIQGHHLSADGVARRTRYYVAADYLRQTGVVEGSGLSRYHLRANVDQQLTSRLSIGLKTSASQIDQRYAGTEFHAGRLVQSALLAVPAGPTRPATFFPFFNPRRELDLFAGAPRTRRLLAQLSASYQFSDALGLSVRGSREQAEARELSYTPEDFAAPEPRLVETGTGTTSAKNLVLDAALRFQRTFADQHLLTAALVYLRQQYEREQVQREYRSTGTITSMSFAQYREKSAPIHSPSANFGYTYAGRYEVQGSLRAEVILGTEYFRTDYRLLPGGQLAWHLHKEAFLANAQLSELTLWAGAGQTSTFFSPDRTTHHDAGLRLGALGGKLALEAGAYQRRTRHAQTFLRLPVPFSPVEYFLVAPPDLTLLNRGLELTLTSAWQLGNLQGSTQVAAATNRNQVEGGVPAGSSALLSSQGLEQGQSVGRFYVFAQDGTHPVGSPLAGQARFRDRNNDGQVNFADGAYQGSGLPRYTLGFYQQLRLKQFQLDAQLDGLFGYELLNPTLVRLDAPSGLENSSVRALDYWTPSRQNTSVPQPGSRSFFTSDQALASGNHLRLSQLTLSYEVLNAGARRASVWAGGQNLFVTGAYRGFDPNVSSGGAAPLQAGQDAGVYPVARVWQVGVRGQF